MADYHISKIQIIYMIIFFPLFLLIVCSILSGAASITYNGFVLDNEGNLYLGKKYKVEVIDPSGKVVHSFPSKASMNYDFTISNDQIVMRAGDDLYWMDLLGNVLEEELRSQRWKQVIPLGNKNIFIDENGTKYTMEYSGFFRTSIFRWNGEQKKEIFKMPLFDYLIRLLALVTLGSFVIMVGYSIGRMNGQGFFEGKLNSFWGPHKL